MFFNGTQYDFSGGPNFQWDNFGLSDLLTFADQGEISLDAVTSLGVFGFGGSTNAFGMQLGSGLFSGSFTKEVLPVECYRSGRTGWGS